jgi:hypothetical protein
MGGTNTLAASRGPRFPCQQTVVSGRRYFEVEKYHKFRLVSIVNILGVSHMLLRR